MSIKRKRDFNTIKDYFGIWKENIENDISKLINIFNRNIKILKKQESILEKLQSIQK